MCPLWRAWTQVLQVFQGFFVPVSWRQSSFTHLVPKAEVAGACNHAVLATDVDHNSFTLPVGNALIGMGAGQELFGAKCVHFSSLKTA